MKSVAKNRNKFLSMEGDIRIKLVFACCVLIFISIPISSFLPQPNYSGKNLQLLQSSDGSLSLSKTAGNTNILPQCTPFYFKLVPINSCNDKLLLLSVPGIGPTLAESILSTRREIGYFLNMKDLLLVPGIGESRMLSFSKHFSFASNSLEE